MGVACRRPAIALVGSIIILLTLSVVPTTWAAQCARRTETSSPMFGAKWAENFVLYTQDYHWKVSGDVTKINLYYGEAEGCVKGIKAQYGADPANAQRLGVETKTLTGRSMQLKEGEHVVRAEYKASSKCIEYLSFRTNQGRQLAVGKHDSPIETAFAAPSNPGSYLGYLNGHTAKPMTNPNVGKLMQLQLVWVTNSCGESDSVSAAAAHGVGSGGGGGKRKKSKQGLKASLFGSTSASSSSDVSTAAADLDSDSDSGSDAGKCVGNHLCKDGKCATSSCMLAGVGSEVPNMMCYGTNMRLPFLSSGMEMSPCSFLGCKLDTSSCTSSGLMGVGGFCTGRVSAMAATSMLHPQGKQWLGYPCVEHRPSTSGFKAAGMLGELTSADDHVAKAWKVCDCVKKVPLRNSIAIMMPNGTIASYVFGSSSSSSSSGSGSTKHGNEQPTVAVPLMPVYDMGLKDVVTQWLAAHAGKAALPQIDISEQLASDLKQLVQGFMTPSIIIANTSAALMDHPDFLQEVPVFVLPDTALTGLKSLLPDLTSLPTLALAPDMTPGEATTMLELPGNLTVADVTVSALPALAAKLDLPTFLKLSPSAAATRPDQKSEAGPHLVSLDKMHIGSVVVQWATAVSRKSPLPRLVLSGPEQLQKLQAKVPGLVTPSIIVPNISNPLLFKQKDLALPLFVLPAELTPDVTAIFPDITALPSYLLLPEQAKQELPKLQLTDFIAPNMRVLVETLGPSIPILLKQVSNISVPTLNLSMAGLAENPAVQSLMSAGPWAHMLSALPDLPDLLVDATNLDVGSIKEVIASVKDALSTSGIKLPYLTLTDDALQKWGAKKLEGFVTNIVTRATTPREDPSLIEEVEEEDKAHLNDDAEDDEDELYSSKKRKRSHHHKKSKKSKHDDDAEYEEAEQTAQKHTKVAAALHAIKEEEKLMDAGRADRKEEKKHGSDGAGKKKKQEQQQQQEKKKEDVAEDKEQQQKPDAAESKPAAADVGAPASSQQPATPGKNKNTPTTNSDEPPSKPAFTPTPAAAAAPEPATPADSKAGTPVPTQPDAAAGSAAATAPKAPKAPKQQPAAKAEPLLPPPPPPPAPTKPLLPIGTEDEDGAVVVDEEAAKRAFMTEEQWAGVTADHKDKLLKLLDVEAR